MRASSKATVAPTSKATAPASGVSAFWTKRRLTLAVVAMLSLHYALAARSLLLENPTVDEVVHLPAGVSYWQTGTFKLYRHNPPLVKLVAALPVLLAHPVVAPAYERPGAWKNEYPSQAQFAQYFLFLNIDRYFDLFTLARLLMPLWSVLGGLVVFAWSRSLYGSWGGLLTLALWCLCPNVLAHGRLITSDLAAAAVGCGATFLFWRYLRQPNWRRALLAGVALGVAQLVKFSMLLLYPLWPVLWLIHALATRGTPWPARLRNATLHGLLVLVASILIIDAGYLFEGVGTPLGDFSFASRSFLTRPGEDLRWRTRPSGNQIIDKSWRHVVNRFRGTPLGAIPSPLPKHFLLGFDEQKIEADGIPTGWLDPNAPRPSEITGYPVYLDGVLRRHGWREYYIKTLLYKVPEGTWALFGCALVLTLVSQKGRAAWRDEASLLVVPLATVAAMTFLTDINLGLRYVLPILPYLFVFCGKLPHWASSLQPHVRVCAQTIFSLLLALTAAASLAIHPHYIAYFNWASGGPARGSEHLIDSNLDWGQDLVGLRDWLRRNGETQPIGLVYFGQISPSLLSATGAGFEWFLPPAIPGRIVSQGTNGGRGPAPRLRPGLYAVSATMLRGLPWRLHEPLDRAPNAQNAGLLISPSWNTREHAFAYFRDLTPLPESIGHSIILYRVSQVDADRINAKYGFRTNGG